MSALWKTPKHGEVFIETGFGHGETLSYVVERPNFKKIYSMDINPVLIEFGRHRFQDDPRVKILQGKSSEVLRTICDPTKQTVFWLDAHYSAGIYTQDVEMDRKLIDEKGEGDCPLLKELAIIKSVAWETPPTILIDDACLFLPEPYQGPWLQYDRSRFPTTEEIDAALPNGYRKITLGHGDARLFYCFKPLV